MRLFAERGSNNRVKKSTGQVPEAKNPRYSCRRAASGSILVARRAGT
jgi:hypothetical protein